MKIKNLLAGILLCLAAASCIRNEAPNAEADIESCRVLADVLLSAPIIENDRITLMIKPYIDEDLLTRLQLDFDLTPGATIDPPGGTVRDFSSPQKYIVTSEDGKWKKEYTITCSVHGIQTEYHFENFNLDKNGRYYEFYEMIPESPDPQTIWASGNSGFALVSESAKPEDYPTAPYEHGKEGHCAKLTTRLTGPLGTALDMPIAPGNLFIGKFNALTALTNALKATRFGRPFQFVPTYLTGYYQYKAGEIFTDAELNVLPDRTDIFDIYAIMYETDDKTTYLDGNNSLTSSNLIAIARFDPADKKEADEWTHFSLPFEYLPGKTIDPDKLKNGLYNISVIFSSSADGATFEGAVGSTLLVDEVTLVHLDDEE